MNKTIRPFLLMMTVIAISACGMTKPHTGYKMQSYTPSSDNSLDTIQPAAGQMVALNDAGVQKKSCAFSSFHRKNAIGYEIDDRRQIGFNVSPSVDVFNPSDAEVKVGLRFSMALGGSAIKRPKCTYGSGYYGFVPYLMNDSVDLTNMLDTNNVKSFVQEKLDERERRQKERDAKVRL